MSIGLEFQKELESEVRATRRCLEAIPENLYDYKPHEKSMNMGYLTLLVADIPRWITQGIEKSVIDFATFEQFTLSTNKALLAHFDKNIEDAKRVLEKVSDQEMQGTFELKRNGELLYAVSKKDHIQSTLNHWVHHRGQLTVYMRMNNIAVPSIYGPSADERTF